MRVIFYVSRMVVKNFDSRRKRSSLESC